MTFDQACQMRYFDGALLQSCCVCCGMPALLLQHHCVAHDARLDSCLTGQADKCIIQLP